MIVLALVVLDAVVADPVADFERANLLVVDHLKELR